MEKTTSKDFAQGLLYGLQKFSNGFYENFSQRAQEILGTKLDEDQLITLKREIYMINMWIISKVLSPDKKVLDELHKIFLLPFTNHYLLDAGHYLLPHVNQKQIDEWMNQHKTAELKNIFEKDKSELDERYKKYYQDWDDNSSMQNILAITMCEYMFNNGQPDRHFVDIRWSFDINAHIISMIKAILDLRKNYEITD